MMKKCLFFFLISQSYLWAQTANDCSNAVVVCGNSTIDSNASGFGEVQEINANTNACIRGENNSLWLQLNIAQSGDLAFTLTPDNPDIVVDYDFLIFPANESCGNFSEPARCSSTNPVNAGLNSNTTGLSANETDFSEGPGANGNSFVAALPVLAGETYFMLIDRPVGNGGFSLEWTGTSAFFESPVLNDFEDFELCIADENTTIDLNNILANITNDATAVVEAYATLANAFDRLEPIQNLGNFLVTQPEIALFIRIQGANGCFEIVDFNINVTNFITTEFSEIGCVQNGSEMAFFNLQNITSRIAQELIDPELYTITFHLDELSANNNLDQINENFFESNTRTIYARIAQTTDMDCFLVLPISLELVVSPIPSVVQLVQCDIDMENSIDGITALNLNEVFNGLENIEDYEFFFFETIVDRENNNAIQNPVGYVNTTPFNQIIFYRAFNTLVNCENFGEIEVQVQPTTISLNDQSPFLSCDINFDGGLPQGIFNLDLIREINYPGLDIQFYATTEDATLETNALFGDLMTISTSIFVRLENSNQCQGVDEIELEVVPTPILEFPEEFFLCTDNPTLRLEGPQGFDTYSWILSTGGLQEVIANTSFVDITEIGSYTLEVGLLHDVDRTPFPCTNSINFEVFPSNRAVIEEIIINSQNGTGTITINVSGDGGYEFSIDGQNYNDSNFFEDIPAGIITVFVRDRRGCGITEELVSIIDYPRFFTPNGDGINDFWQLIGVNSEFQPSSTVSIFDRYGKLLTFFNTSSPGWDGTFNSRRLPESDYWFRTVLEDGREFKGHFTLKR